MNPRSKTQRLNNYKFCKTCGEEGISACPECNGEIHGSKYLGRMWNQFYSPAAYCHECGKAYPWTEKHIKAAQDLIALSDLPVEQKKDYARAVEEITKDSPAAKSAAQKIKIYSKKVTKEVGKGVYQIAVDIASETMKKILTEP